ncbi:hypothetical protein K438DRAFT_1765189 [Mycena galopus ATCC 62051]|nr:hypothetical protein K438DRAFT_1765189 [Mycena galopus ATCC 62051]
MDGSVSVRIAGLLLALCTGLDFGNFSLEDPMLMKIIAGTVDSPNSVGAPGTGNQFLGILHQIYLSVNTSVTQHSAGYILGEVFDSKETAGTRDFFAIYAPWGVTVKSNFTIIFTVRQELEPTPFLLSYMHGSDFSRTYSGSSTTSDDMFSKYNITSSEPNHLGHPFSTPPLLNFFPQSIVSPTPFIPSTHSPTSRDTPTPPRQVKTRGRLSSLLKNITVIKLILPFLIPPVSDSAFRAADFTLSDTTTQLAMIQNYITMCNLLATLTTTKDTKVFPDRDGNAHTLSGIVVLKASNWNENTFKNKASCYQNAEKAANLEWKGVIPDDCHNYNKWLVIVYMWSVLGPVATGIPPSKVSSNKIESNAACLIQSDLERIGSDAFRTKYLKRPVT